MAVFEIEGPDGSIFEVEAPDSATEQEILDFAKANFETAQVAQPEEDQSTLFSRIGDRVDKRQETVSREIDKFVRDVPITGNKAALNLIGDITGQSAGAVWDTAGEAIVTGLKEAANLPPEEFQDVVATSWESMMNAIPSEIKVALGSGTEDVMDKYQELKESHPDEMLQLENLTNILLLASPAPKGTPNPAAKPGVLGKIGKKISRKGKVQAGTERRETILELVRPKKVSVKDAPREIRRTVETGVIRGSKKQATNFEKAMARDVSKVPGLKLNRSELHSANKINDHITNISDQLGRSMAALPAPKQSLAQKTMKGIDDGVDKLLQSEIFLNQQGTAVRALRQKAKSIVAAADDTVEGMWAARKEFDDWVRQQSGGQLPDVQKALGSVNSDIRNTMNKVMHEEGAKHGLNINRRFQNMRNLIEANKIVSVKAEKLGANAIMRTVDNAKKVVGARNAALTLFATALGTTVIGAAQVVSAPLGASITAGVITAGIFRGLKTPAVKKGLGSLLKATDDAIKASVDPVMLQQLRADRALIVELSKHLERGRDAN